MNSKAWIPLVAALVLGLVAAFMARSMMGQQPTANTELSSLKKVVVVKERVGPGQALTPDKLMVARMSMDLPAEQLFSNPADLANRITATALVPGQVLVEPLLVPKGSGPGLQSLVPEGMRAVTLEVDEFTGVAGLLVPGCHVDIITTLQDVQTGEAMARTIVQNIKVSAIGPRLAISPGEEGKEAFRSVTLMVTPKDAEMLGLAVNSASRPRLVLRNNKDDSPNPSTGVTLAELRGKPRKAPEAMASANGAHGATLASDNHKNAPATQPAEPTTVKHNVQVIRGGVETTVTFEIPRKATPQTASIPLNQ